MPFSVNDTSVELSVVSGIILVCDPPATPLPVMSLAMSKWSSGGA